MRRIVGTCSACPRCLRMRRQPATISRSRSLATSSSAISTAARAERGKGAAREMRRQGMIPAVVYGGGREATAIAIDRNGFERMLEKSHSGVNTLIDLAGDSEAAGRTVIAKELQREAVRGALIHVDFYEIDLSSKIEVAVPIHLTGTAAGVVLGGDGTLGAKVCLASDQVLIPRRRRCRRRSVVLRVVQHWLS